MNNKLAQQLQDKGFPLVTKWEVENNYHRHIPVKGEPSMPLFECIASEIKDFGGVIKTGNGWYAFQEEIYPYPDGMTQLFPPDEDDKEEYSETPIEAVAKLWLSLLSNPL